MAETDSIANASRRLALALDALEAAADRRTDADRGTEALANQVHVLGADRAQLAGELDQVTARSRALETTNREVVQRIDQAIQIIRSVLESDD